VEKNSAIDVEESISDVNALKIVYSLVYLVNYSIDLSEMDSFKVLYHKILCIKMQSLDKISSMEHLETHHNQIMGPMEAL
jgi:hypothetical protein